ncbi:MAG: chlorite dismutase family protein, partial [Nitrospirota bacterium]|nr:chlorite dismutase family protein [Nitrospirota bacterium]
LVYTISGVIKGLNYAPDFPDLLEKLKMGKYEGEPPQYAIMIPIRKNAAWWNLSKEDRVAMMKEHTLPTLSYLKSVKRKLYHATGLSDADFLTIFETNNLVDFNNLVIALRMVREDTFNVQLGEPTVIGTIKSWNDIVDLLVK